MARLHALPAFAQVHQQTRHLVHHRGIEFEARLVQPLRAIVVQATEALDQLTAGLVSFPPGIDTGHRLRVPGQGMPGPPNTQPGDLYVDVEVEAHARFERHGDDLAIRSEITFAEAALGTKIEITLPDDNVITATVPAGTQPNAVVRVKGKGMPLLQGRGHGDLHVVVGVTVPTRLSKRAKQLLEELDAELRGDGEKRSAG